MPPTQNPRNRPGWTQRNPTPQPVNTPPRPDYRNPRNWQNPRQLGQGNYRDMGQQYAGQYAGGAYRPPVQPTATRRNNPPPVRNTGAPTSTGAGGGYYTGNVWHSSNYGPYQDPTQGYYVGYYEPQPVQPTQPAQNASGSGGGYSSGPGGFGGGWGGGGGGGWGYPSAREIAAWARLVNWNINR